jgi:Flp pilus assembly protein TadD
MDYSSSISNAVLSSLVIFKRQRALPAFFAPAVLFLSSLLGVAPTCGLTKASVGHTSRADQAIATPTDTDALAEAKSLLAQGKADDADRAVRAYLETHPTSADAHFLRGYILFRQIQMHAVTSGEAAPNSYREPGAHAPNAASLQSTAEASLAEFTEGAKYHPPSAFDLKIVALDYVLLNDYVDADKWLTRSLQWNPKDADTWYYLGRAKYNENRFADAVQCFQQVLKLDAKNVKAQDNLGLSYEGLGQTDAAMAAYQTAIAWQSDSAVKNPGPLLDLGILLMEQNRTQQAVPYLTQAVTIAPKEPRHHEELGKAYLRLEEWQKAQEELETAVALSPQNSRLHYLLGRVYSKEGLAEKAKEEFARSETLKAAESTASPQARP